MKKVMVLVMVLGLLAAGCCTRMVGGKETKSFGNCLATAQDYVCNPPQEVVAVVTTAAPLLVTVVNALVPGTAAYINAVNAAQTAQALQSGLCVFVTDLNNLISVLQSPDTQAAQAKMVSAKALPAPINTQVLINWEVTKGKKPGV